jgi:diguanylate cyclase (GGDEF)-like protein
MSQALQACQSVGEACTAIVQSGQILFPTEFAALYLMRPSREVLDYRTGWGGTGVEAAILAPESCWALRRGQVFRCGPVLDGLPCAHVAAEPPAGPTICVPLVAHGDSLGLLHIRFPAPDGAPAAGTFESRLRLATTFAAQAALALGNLKLSEVLKEQTLRDPLTGLHNRRFLEETLERELDRARRIKAPLALIMADIDDFKRLNDTHGHDAGDAVLRSVAKALASHVRGSDIACRFGGEEFTLVLPETALDAAFGKTESLRREIAALVLSHAGQALGTVTMSLGLALFPAHGRDAAGLLQAADMALYRAKRAGRNRTLVSNGGNPAVAPSASGGLPEIESESA